MLPGRHEPQSRPAPAALPLGCASGLHTLYPVDCGKHVQAEELRRFLDTRREAEQEAPRQFRILVVDDDRLVQDYVADMLQASGFDCVVEVLSLSQLKRDMCRLPRTTGPASFHGRLPQAKPRRPAADDAPWDGQVLWDFLKSTGGWDCVNVCAKYAMALGDLMATDLGTPVGYYDDVYHVLPRPVVRYRNPHVRRLRRTDLRLLERAPEAIRDSGFGDPATLLRDGIAAGAIIDRTLVSLAHTYSLTSRHADLGVYTLDAWRCRGFASAAASIVAHRAQKAGLTPAWRTEHDNTASLRVARKLGFVELTRRTYVVPEKKAR